MSSCQPSTDTVVWSAPYLFKGLCVRKIKDTWRGGNFDDNIHWSGSDKNYNSEDGSELGYEYKSDDIYETVCEEHLSG